MRESSWLTSEEAENRLARHEGYVLSPVFFRRAIFQTALLVGGAAFLIGAVMATIANPAYLPMAMASVGVLSLGAIPLVVYWERRQVVRHEPDLGLVEGFGGGKGWLVELIVRQGDAPTGIDRGMLWIEDDRLFFSGHRTSFGLVPSQARCLTDDALSVPHLCHGFNLRLREESPVGPVNLSFGLFLRSGAVEWAEKAEFRARIEEWLVSRTSKPGQLPPLQIGPGAPSERQLLAEAAFSGLAIPLTVLLVFKLAAFAVPLAIFLFLLQETVALRLTSAPLRVRALLDRRRLRRAR